MLKNKSICVLILIFVIVFVIGCGVPKKEDISKKHYDEVKREQLYLNTQDENKKKRIAEKKIIKKGRIEFETSNIDKTRKILDESVERYGAYISKEEMHSYTHKIEQIVEVRVPAEKFDHLIRDITKHVKKLDKKHIEAVDVTEEYFDIELRIKIKKETEERYRQLLSEAKTIEEILSIEKQIEEVRTAIESLEGKLKYMEDQISYSTLIVKFYQIIFTPIDFISNFTSGIKNGWNNFLWFLVGLANMWPFVLLIIGIVLLIFYRRRKRWKIKQ